MRTRERVSIEAILFALYVALAPANQIMKLGSGDTINKYIGLAVIVIIALKKIIYGENFSFSLINRVLPLFLWICISIVWSINKAQTIGSIISLGNYILLWLIVAEKEWNESEKTCIKYTAIIVGLYISVMLVQGQYQGIRRSTLVLDSTGEVTDQNGLAVALTYVFIISLHSMFKTDRVGAKALFFASCLVLVTGIFSTGSRGAVLALIGSFVYFMGAQSGYFSKNTIGGKAAIIIGIGVLIYLIFGKNQFLNEQTIIRYTDDELVLGTGGSGRFEIWEMYISILNRTIYPYIVGFGYGTTFNAFTQYMWNWAPGTHNTYLYLLVCSGAIGVVIFIRFIVDHIKECTQNGDILSKACIVAALIAMITLDMFTNKGFWNMLTFAQIGIGSTYLVDTKTTGTSIQKQSRYIR